MFGGMFVCLALSFNARRNILILRCSWDTLGYSYIYIHTSINDYYNHLIIIKMYGCMDVLKILILKIIFFQA